MGIPTIGRAGILSQIAAELHRQTCPPDTVIVCGTEAADLDGVARALPDARLILAPAGLPCQRNAIITAAIGADVLVFFDDDFLADTGYLAAVRCHMVKNPRTVLVTGRVVADGINGPGLSPAEALTILERRADASAAARAVFSAYGCNMAMRLAPVREHGLWFDERLPLYGWQEDVDMSRRLARFGDVVQLDAARGVHLGTKLGRGSGVRLGYSQVANPVYLVRKGGCYPLGRALSHIACNVGMNILRSVWPEPYVDRRGRLRGNALAIYDLLSGRILPERILEL